MRTHLSTILVWVIGLGALAGCSNADAPSSPASGDHDTPKSSSTLRLHSQMNHDSDVEEITFNIRECDSSAIVASKTKSLEEMMIPGGIASWEDEPFDEDSAHLFADGFFTLDAGCYDVETIPLDNQSGAPDDDDDLSEDCEPAHRDDVQVDDGGTTEILLVNQCDGDARGGLDVVGAINHPPKIINLTFDDSKFLSSCRANTVCVRAEDPDDDPLEFVWETVATPGSGSPINAVVKTSERRLENGTWESCARIVPGQSGTTRLGVDVFDLDGNGRRLEQLLAEQDSAETLQSRDTLQFPAHSQVRCPLASRDLDGDDEREDLLPTCGLDEPSLIDVDRDDDPDVISIGAECEAGEPLIPTSDVDNDGLGELCNLVAINLRPTRVDIDGDGLADTRIFLQPDDSDEDGIVDPCDNCPTSYNPDQTDSNDDGIADACSDRTCEVVTCASTDLCYRGRCYPECQADGDCVGQQQCIDTICVGGGLDSEGDFRADQYDNCPNTANLAQNDLDDDGVGNVCDPDIDGDGVPNTSDSDNDDDGVDDANDNCRLTPNPSQSDIDNDGRGDACDRDTDDDGVDDPADNCLFTANPDQDDSDGDGAGDACDNCLQRPNSRQTDSNGDGTGDLCAPSRNDDGDGFDNRADNCPLTTNPGQTDSDGDRIGDACDNCPNVANLKQRDDDRDGVGNACE